MMKIGSTFAAVMLLTFTPFVQADNRVAHYKIEITNITKGMSFTPFLAASHTPKVAIFKLGEPASDELAQMAEGGDIVPLHDMLLESGATFSTTASEGLLTPGATVTLMLDTPLYSIWQSRLSLAAMLLPTNDTFVSLNSVSLPIKGEVSYLANAYDAGSEPNDELCTSIPGPTCGGGGYSPNVDGETYVYPSPAIHGEGDLSVAKYNWSGPVAKINVKRMR